MCLLQLLGVDLTIIGWLTRIWTQQWFTLNELGMLELSDYDKEKRSKGIRRYKYWSTYLNYGQPIQQSPNYPPNLRTALMRRKLLHSESIS